MKIILLGYMGSGKSTIGKLLSKVLGYTFIDFDEYIEQKEGTTIQELFKQKGEIYFRKQESTYLAALLANEENMVVSLGGGTPCYSNNMEQILKATYTKAIYLKASIKTLTERLLKNRAKRPMISHVNDHELYEFVAKHLFERRNFYQQTKWQIIVDEKSVYEVVDELKMMLH